MGFPGHYKLKEGWDVKTDLLQEHIIYFVLNGTIDGAINGQVCLAPPNEVVIIPPQSQIHFRALNGGQIELLRFRLIIETAGQPAPVLDRFFQQSAPGCRDYFNRIIHEAEIPGPGTEWKTRGLLIALLAEAFYPPEPSSDGPMLSPPQLRQVRAYFRERHTAWPTPANLAEQVRLSPDYFARAFRRTVGMPPRRWMTEERIRLAALTLRESNQNISETAESFGYSDVYFFSQQFKSVMGMSPKAYRQSVPERGNSEKIVAKSP